MAGEGIRGRTTTAIPQADEEEVVMAERSPAAQTAFGPMVIAACEHYVPEPQRLIHDELAVRFLPLNLRLAVQACRWRPIRNVLINFTEKQAPGIWGGTLCRKRYADERVAEAMRAGITQVVVLGAGMDTRVYRLAAPSGVSCFEIDLPENVANKRGRLQANYGRVPEHVTLIPVDLETQDVGEELAVNGFDVSKTAMFVWEAVTQYLTTDGVRETFAMLAKAVTGSRLIFTYVRTDFLDGANLYGADSVYERFVVKYGVWHWGIDPADIDGLLREYGWTEREQVGRDEYVARYVKPSGRDLPVTEIERFVFAEKL
jgi:methyltransferase (TIGR00027 family)